MNNNRGAIGKRFLSEKEKTRNIKKRDERITIPAMPNTKRGCMKLVPNAL